MRRFVSGVLYLKEVDPDLGPDAVPEKPGPRGVELPGGGIASKVHARSYITLSADRYLVVHGGFATVRMPHHGTISVPRGTYRILSVEGVEIDGW